MGHPAAEARIRFQGALRRAEFWTFVVLAIALSIAARLVDEALGHHSPRIDAQGYERSVAGPVLAVVTLALLLPGLAVTVRRLHDIDRRGSWISCRSHRPSSSCR